METMSKKPVNPLPAGLKWVNQTANLALEEKSTTIEDDPGVFQILGEYVHLGLKLSSWLLLVTPGYSLMSTPVKP